ncbi:MAG: AAA family ATPase [Spirulinaceae cyanobacterium]
MKRLIIGNSGSGKTWLAEQLAPLDEAALIHFDDLFWQPGGFEQKREQQEILALIAQSKQASNWIAEGIFGNLARQYLAAADELIWLDLPLDLCLERLRHRSAQNTAHMNRQQTEQGLQDLLTWTAQYYDRTTPSSYSGHQKLFQAFAKTKHHLCNPDAVEAFWRDRRANLQQATHPESAKHRGEITY